MYYRCIIHFDICTFVPQEFSTKIPHLCVNTTIANKRSSTSMCATLVPAVNNRSMHFRPSHCIICALHYPLDDDKTRSKMMVQFESQRPPIFKVQWVKKGATHLILCMYIYGIQCDFMPKIPKEQTYNQNP